MALQVWLHGKDLINNGLCPNNATWDGPATYADGKLGKCYSCTGSHYISYVYDFASTDKFTIAFWIYIPTSLSTCNRWEQVFCLQEYNINWADYNNLKIYDNSSNQLWWLDGNMFYDKWVHLTIAHNADTITLYINGDHYNTATSTSSPISSGTMYAGRGITNEHGPVKFNDIRLYDHCLSPKEVKEISKGLVLHYPLNDIYNGSYNLLNDSDTFANWSDYEAGYTEVKINEFGRKSLIITNKRSWCGAVHSVQIPSAGIYTISCYCKPISRTKTSIEQTLYISGNGLNDQYVKVDWNKTNQWQRLSLTCTYNQAGSFYVYLIAFGGSRTDDYKVTCEYTMPQVTKTDTTVPYVEKSIPDSTVYDCSGYQNNGTITGSLSCSTDSPRYKISTHFTSSIPSRIMLPSDMSCLSGNNEQTLSCWVKSSGLGSGMSQSGLIALGYGNSLFLSDSDYCYRIDNGTNLNSIWANQNPHDGKWHLVTATYKSGIASIYIDGILKNSISRTFSNRYINNGLNCIGSEANNSSVYNINGDISDVRMYTTALSAEDIKELYNTSCIINS